MASLIMVEAWEAGMEEMKCMGRRKAEVRMRRGGMLKGVTEMRLGKRLRVHFPGTARLTGVRPGALGTRSIRDQVRAAEAHEFGAAPQRLPQRSRLLAEAPLALPEAGQG